MAGSKGMAGSARGNGARQGALSPRCTASLVIVCFPLPGVGSGVTGLWHPAAQGRGQVRITHEYRTGR